MEENTNTNTIPQQPDSGSANILEEIRNLNKKQLFFQRISACCMVVICLVLVIAVAVLVPRVISTLNHIDTVAKTAESELENVDVMVAEITDAAGNLNSLVEDNAESLTNAVNSLSGIDFEGLNQAITDLQDAIGPLARFANMFSR